MKFTERICRKQFTTPSGGIQGVSKNCENRAHTKPLSWIYLLDVQGVDTYLFTDFL